MRQLNIRVHGLSFYVKDELPAASISVRRETVSAFCYSCNCMVECSNDNEAGSWLCPEGHRPNRQPSRNRTAS